MRHTFHYMLLVAIGCLMAAGARAQHQFKGTSLSEALITLDHSSERYDISFLYDELEDFTVTKTIRRGCPLPEAVREKYRAFPDTPGYYSVFEPSSFNWLNLHDAYWENPIGAGKTGERRLSWYF